MGVRLRETRDSARRQRRMAAAPRALVHVHALDGSAGEEAVLRSLRAHHYAHQVQVFGPGIGGAGSAPAALACPAFTVATIQPVAVLHERFLRDYIARGSLYVLATGAAAERHNSLCIAGDGILRLVVDAETYRRLGLVGTPSAVHPGGQFFHVQVDLAAPGFRAGDSAYDRAAWCLGRMQPVRVLASHSPSDGSAAAHVRFEPELQTDARAASCRPSSHALASGARVPTLQAMSALAAAHEAPALQAEEVTDLLEWLGFVHGDFGDCIAPGAAVDEFATGLKSPQVLACSPGSGRVQQVRGFITAPDVQRLLAAAVDQVRTGQLPWASLVAWGFEDTPVSWGRKCHCFADGSGDNHSVVVVLPGAKSALVMHLVSGRDEHA